MLHHRISSVLCCNQNTHFMQGPKNDYTHAYNHPLSNLLSSQSPFWSLSVFWLLNFLVFIFAQLPLVNRRHTIWIFTRIWLFSQSTLQKAQCTLYILKLNFLFFFWGFYDFGLVYWYGGLRLACGILLPLQHSAALCPYLPQFWHFPLNFPYIMPSSIGVNLPYLMT